MTSAKLFRNKTQHKHQTEGVVLSQCPGVCILVPCAGRAFGPSPARGPGLYIILRAGPGLGLHTAGPGRAWAENNLNTSGLGRAWA